jgi:hypothetical protein
MEISWLWFQFLIESAMTKVGVIYMVNHQIFIKLVPSRSISSVILLHTSDQILLVSALSIWIFFEL